MKETNIKIRGNALQRGRRFIKNQPVLAVSFLLAAVSCFIHPPGAQTLAFIDWATLACLFCLMAAVRGLEGAGVLQRLVLLLRRFMGDARRAAVLFTLLCFFVSMFFTNDVTLIALVPLTLLALGTGVSAGTAAYIVVLETAAANIGSALTPIGNPHNLFLFTHYGMEVPLFMQTMLPYTLGGFVLLLLCCLPVKRAPLQKTDFFSPAEVSACPFSTRRAVFFGLLFMAAVLAVLRVYPYWMALVFVLFSVFADKRALRVDYGLLATFVFLFVLVGNLSGLPLVQNALSAFSGHPVVVAVAASQVVSNVPAAILLSNFTKDGYGLLVGVNIGGVGTLIASMASVISFQIFLSRRPGFIGGYLLRFTLINLLALLLLLGIWLLLG